MTTLSDLMCQHLGLQPGSSATDLVTCLEQGHFNILDGLLGTETSRIAASQSLSDLAGYTLEVVSRTTPLQDKFCKVLVEGSALPVLIGLIGDESVENPVTDLENLLFWAAVDTRLDWQASWVVSNGGEVVDWRNKAKGNAVVAYPAALVRSEPLRRLLAALFSLQHNDLPISTLQTRIASQALQIAVRRNPNDYNQTQARLVFEAVSESNPKWRCLSLYRILENAYLNNIKRIFIEQFDLDAKAAVEAAKKSVASELNQLIVLTETLDLRTEFVAFNDAIEALLMANNKFIQSLDKGAREDKENYGSLEIYKKAVLRFYKLRCAIAHGGTSSVIYEQFVDANQAAIALLPSIESIALKSIKLEIVAI